VGVGQFCTNPGLIVLQRTSAAEQFVQELAAKLAATPEAPMLTPGIRQAFATNTAARSSLPGVKKILQTEGASTSGVVPVWFETEAGTFLANRGLSEEIFGPSSLVVWCRDRAEMLAVARQFPGSLTATLHAGAAEAGEQGELVELLAARVGRVILNGFPTGLEVSHAIVHGGPYPSTSDGGRSTSVGTRALNRWTRLVCYQGFADSLLPPELQNANPLGLLRMVNGQTTRDPT